MSISLRPWRQTIKKPLPGHAHKKGILEALHATNAWWTRAFLCAKFVIAWPHLNDAIYDSITQKCKSFATIACRTFWMNVTCVGGKKSSMITLYLMTPSWKTAFHSTFGYQLVTINAGAATATPFGSHVDGDAGHKPSIWVTCYLHIAWELAMDRGATRKRSQLKWLTLSLRFSILWSYSQKMSVTTPKRRDWKVYRWTRSYNIFLTTTAILIVHWWCNQLRQLMLVICMQYRSHATTAGGVKTYL